MYESVLSAVDVAVTEDNYRASREQLSVENGQHILFDETPAPRSSI